MKGSFDLKEVVPHRLRTSGLERLVGTVPPGAPGQQLDAHSIGKMARKELLFDQGLQGARPSRGSLVGGELWRSSFNV